MLKNLPIDCKMVESENLHISLSFLGDIEDEKVGVLSSALDSICKNYSRFAVEIGGIRFIPSEKYIRVLALDVIDNGTLKSLSKEIKQKIGGDVKLPHLTLCRVRDVKNEDAVVDKIKKFDVNVESFVISSISLIKSELKKTGPIYTDLHQSNLL
jgi:2'-5' RNA ligase